MQKIDNPEERTVGRNGGTHASAVSKMLLGMGYVRFHAHDTNQGGYYCSNWGTDTQGGTMVKVEYRRPGRGLKGKSSEDTINRVRRAKLTEMSKGLRRVGYYVSWGWDKETGDPDTTFIVASVNPPRDGDVPGQWSPETAFSEVYEGAEESFEEPQKDVPEPEPVRKDPGIPEDALEPLRLFLISIADVEETVREIHRAHNAGKDDAARRMEHMLYQKVLLAIVGRSFDEPRTLAAAALATQHLSIPR